MGGLIGINDTWLRAGVVLNNTDCNTLTESRLYYVQTGNTNRPSPDWGFLCVLKAHNDMILQLFVDKVNTLIKTRIRYGGSWTEWRTISLS